MANRAVFEGSRLRDFPGDFLSLMVRSSLVEWGLGLEAVKAQLLQGDAVNALRAAKEASGTGCRFWMIFFPDKSWGCHGNFCML